MARVAMIGSGKLGFPVGCVMAQKGHSVSFYDTNQALLNDYQLGKFPEEVGLAEIIKRGGFTTFYASSLDHALMNNEFIFVAVQTPHAPEQDGSVRFNHVRTNFDLSYVKQAVSDISDWLLANPSKEIRKVIIISTMLPGSMDQEIAPLFKATQDELIYSPSFIAMGTVVHDFQNPEFWLVGSPAHWDNVALKVFYHSIAPAKFLQMSYSSAEATKVLYNTWITMKITLANLAMEVAHKIPGCDSDDITEALSHATRRLLGPEYMHGGMVDGGGCHPRDNIALSWLSDKLDLSYNLFDYMMFVREQQVEFLADLIEKHRANRPVVLSNPAFKAGTNITAGSPAILLQNILKERGIEATFFKGERYDPTPICLVLTTKDTNCIVKPEDIVIDPWRITRRWHNSIKIGAA